MHTYPGPEHYSGDVLTFEIPVDADFSEASNPVTLTLDNRDTTEVPGQWLTNRVLPLAFDTTGLTGHHTLTFITSNGNLNRIYAFEVLPADQRPSNEEGATWRTNETACCMLHYISETAAARDIAFIAEHFQHAAEDFAMITGKKIDPKLDVYFIDRMWGNGARSVLAS